MKPVTFKQSNAIFKFNAEDHKEYLSLPVHVTKDYAVVSCWQLTFVERLHILLTGRLWFSQMTLGNFPQQQLPQVESPFK